MYNLLPKHTQKHSTVLKPRSHHISTRLELAVYARRLAHDRHKVIRKRRELIGSTSTLEVPLHASDVMECKQSMT